jgi:cytochrome c biogenesis protein CcmG, thiol:disulfide interchange protein DsbE
MSIETTRKPRRKRPSRLYAVAAGFAVVFIVMAWVARDRFRPVGAGSAAPDFTATNLAGAPVNLSDYKGKVVLVNVWATWCEPCKKEMPSMERLRQQIHALPGGEDFEILAVSIDAASASPDEHGSASESDLEKFAKDMGLGFTILHDPGKTVMELYQTTGVPESFIVGRDGAIALKRAADQEWDTPPFVELITRLLRAAPAQG